MSLTKPAKATQLERVAAQLKAVGDRGVTQIDFDAPDVIDGGPPIRRVTSRIGELKNQGWRIETRSGPLGMARYVVTGRDGRTSVEPTPGEAAPIEKRPAEISMPASPYDPFSDWA